MDKILFDANNRFLRFADLLASNEPGNLCLDSDTHLWLLTATQRFAEGIPLESALGVAPGRGCSKLATRLKLGLRNKAIRRAFLLIDTPERKRIPKLVDSLQVFGARHWLRIKQTGVLPTDDFNGAICEVFLHDENPPMTYQGIKNIVRNEN